MLHTWVVSKIALPDDDEMMVKRKRVLVWFYLLPAMFGIVGFFACGFNSGKAASLLCATANAFASVWLFVKKKPSEAFIEAMCFLDLASICMLDYNNMGAMLQRAWPLSVIVVNVMLVCRVRRRSAVLLMMCLCLWLILTVLEELLRFGLLDIGGDAFNGGQTYRYREACSCTRLPCTSSYLGNPLITFCVMICCVCFDFYFTRGFADEVLSEKRKLELGVLAARDVASFLACFQLDEAGTTLHASEADLPDKLFEALHTILVNLQSYKPYLPQSCLQHDQSDQADDVSGLSHSSKQSTASGSPRVTPALSESLVVQMLSPARATMLVMNIKHSTSAMEADPADFTSLHSRVISFALRVIRSQKGMLDLFVGDHVHASFNASKKCAQHALAGVKAATTLRRGKLEKDMEVNVAVCSGKVQVGDLGNDEVRRFSIYGHAAVLTSVYERLGAEWGIGVVCNTAAYMDASVTLEMLIVLKVVTFVKHGNGTEAFLWEALNVSQSLHLEASNSKSAAKDTNEEWMYSLQGSKAGYWANYNEAAKMYLHEKCFEDEKAERTAQGLLATYKNEPLAEIVSHFVSKKVPVERHRQTY